MQSSLLIENFIEMLIAERGLTSNSCFAYKTDLLAIAEKLKSRGQDFLTVQMADLEALMGQFAAHLAPNSQARRLSVLKQFYQFLYNEDLCPDAAMLLARPKLGFNLPKIISQGKMLELLEQSYKLCQQSQHNLKQKRRAIRLYVLLELLYNLGLRISEAVTLPLNILYEKSSFVTILGKGKKERLLPLPLRVKKALALWQEVRSTGKLASAHKSYLFPASKPPFHLARQVAARHIKAHGAAFGMPQLAPHMIRHAFASHLLQGGADLRIVQQLLGHSDIKTTQIYTHIRAEELYNFVQKYHPLAAQIT